MQCHEALHQQPCRFACKDLYHPGGPSNMPRNVVNHVPKLVRWETKGNRLKKSSQNQFGCRCGATATWEDSPEGPKGKSGARVCFEETPAFVRSSPTGQKPPWELRFGSLLPEMVVPDMLVELDQAARSQALLLATPEIVRVVILFPLLRQWPEQAGWHTQRRDCETNCTITT